MSNIPGQPSFITLTISATWTIFMLLIMIAGHLLMVLWAWQAFFHDNGLQALAETAGVEADILIAVMAMAIISDIWAHFGAKKSIEESVRRRSKR